MATLTDTMKEYIAQNLAYLATVDNEGNPDIGPKLSLRVLDDHRLIYNEMTEKLIYQDLKANGRVLVAVANERAKKGFRFGGKVTLYEDGEYFENGLKWAGTAYPRPHQVGVIDIDTIWTLDPGPLAGELYKE